MINVRLLLGTHTIYENLLKYPPTNIKYFTNISLSDFDTLKIYKSKYYNIKKKLALKALDSLGLPRLYFVKDPKDLIHSSRGLLILNRTPWVVDAEIASSFGNYTHSRVRQITQRLLSSKYCKKIMPHCEAAQKSILNAYDCSKFKDKFEVVYPSIVPNKIAKGNEKPQILFISKWDSFYRKGGKEVLAAFELLKKKYDINLVMKTDAPLEFIKHYEKRGVTFKTEIVTRKELFEKYYLKSDIFVMPTFTDSFGYVFLEAMSCGLPLIGTDIFAVPEIIEDGKNGFLVHTDLSEFSSNYLHRNFYKTIDYSKITCPDIVKQLVEKISILVENPKLRRKMGLTGYKIIENGKFSIKVRNEKLKRIYEEAIKK